MVYIKLCRGSNNDPRLSVAKIELTLHLSHLNISIPFRRITPNGFRNILINPMPKLCGLGARDIFCFLQIMFRALVADSTTRRLMRVGR